MNLPIQLKLATLDSGQLNRFGDQSGQTVRSFIGNRDQSALLLRKRFLGIREQIGRHGFNRRERSLEFVSNRVQKSGFQLLALASNLCAVDLLLGTCLFQPHSHEVQKRLQCRIRQKGVSDRQTADRFSSQADGRYENFVTLLRSTLDRIADSRSLAQSNVRKRLRASQIDFIGCCDHTAPLQDTQTPVRFGARSASRWAAWYR